MNTFDFGLSLNISESQGAILSEGSAWTRLLLPCLCPATSQVGINWYTNTLFIVHKINLLRSLTCTVSAIYEFWLAPTNNNIFYS